MTEYQKEYFYFTKEYLYIYEMIRILKEQLNKTFLDHYILGDTVIYESINEKFIICITNKITIEVKINDTEAYCSETYTILEFTVMQHNTHSIHKRIIEDGKLLKIDTNSKIYKEILLSIYNSLFKNGLIEISHKLKKHSDMKEEILNNFKQKTFLSTL